MNLKELEPYIVIPVADAKIQDHADHALRIMDGEIEPGVRALWCDDEASVLAILFDGRFTEEQARAWVKEAEAQGVNLEPVEPPTSVFNSIVALISPHLPPVVLDSVLHLLGQSSSIILPLQPVALVWEETENEIRHSVRPASDFRSDTFRSKSLKGIKGVRLILGKLKASKVPKGKNPDSMVPQSYRFDKKQWTMTKAKKWVAKHKEMALESFTETTNKVRIALTRLYEYTDADNNPHYLYIHDIGPDRVIFELDNLCWAVTYSINDDDDEVLMGEPIATERAWVEKGANEIVELTMYAFPVSGALLTEAGEDVVGDDGNLVWKEICKVGHWYKLSTGRRIEITAQFLQSIVAAFAAKVVPYVSVPADGHHFDTGGIVPAENNTGFVEQLKLVQQSLWAGFNFTDMNTKQRVEDGTIKDVSIFALPSVHDPRNGDEWDWVLMHVLLTNYPQVRGLAPFGNEAPVAATAITGARIIYLEEVRNMPETEVTLTEEQAQQYQALQALNLSAEQLAAWQAQDLSFDRIMALLHSEEELRAKARDLEVQRIVLALQGQGEHDNVVQVNDTRHWPVVCTAIEAALREQPTPLALSVGDDGTTSLDEVVLSIVNAIPAEGRMSLTAQPDGDREPVEGNRKPTDEQIDELDKRLR